MIINSYRYASSSGDPIAASLLSKLVSWWPHNEPSGSAFADSHGGKTGLYVGSPSMSTGGVTFGGSSHGQISASADDPDFQINDFTAGLRVKFTTSQTSKYIFNKWASSSGSWLISTGNTNTNIRGLAAPGGTNATTQSTAINDGNFRLVMLTRTGTELRLSVSGQSDIVTTCDSGAIPDNANLLTWAKNADGTFDLFQGTIAHSFFSAALDSDERDFILNGGAFRTYADIVAAA